MDETIPGVYVARHVTASGWTAFYESCGYVNGPPHVIVDGVTQSYLNSFAQGLNVTASSPRPDGQTIVLSGGTYYLEGGDGNVAPKKRKFYSTPAFLSYNFQRPTCSISGYSEVTPVLKAREGTRFLQSGSTTQYLVDRVMVNNSPTYLKRHLTAGGLNFYGYNGPLPGWSSAEASAYSTDVHAHPVAALWPDRWHWNISASNPLKFDRVEDGAFPCPGCLTLWNQGISNGINQWIDSNTTIKYQEWPYSGNNHMHVIVTNQPNIFFGGWTILYENGVPCGTYDGPQQDCPGVSYHQAAVYLNNPRVANSTSARNALVSHELGHSSSLAHPFFYDNGVCDGVQLPVTIMDFDCMSGAGGVGVAPRDWDVCGVNHKYSSASGYAGC